MESRPFLKAERDKFWSDVEASHALRQFHETRPDAATDWLGVKSGAAKVAAANGTEFTYGPGDKPSDEFIELILNDLKELGVEVKVNPLTGQAALSGNVAQVSTALLASIKRHKEHLICYIRNVRTVFRRPSTEVELPEAFEPIEWDNGADEFGRCQGRSLPETWARWRYLYGPRRHTWHSRTGWEWEEGNFEEPEETETEERYKGKKARRYWPYKPKPVKSFSGCTTDEIPD